MHHPEKIDNFQMIVIDEVCLANIIYLQEKFSCATFYIYIQVHELSSETDMLLGLIRALHDQHIKKTKGATYAVSTPTPNESLKFPDLLLVSATMDKGKFFDKIRPQSFFDKLPIKTRPRVDEITYEVEIGVNSGYNILDLTLEQLGTKLDLDTLQAEENFVVPAKGFPKRPDLFPETISLMFETLNK